MLSPAALPSSVPDAELARRIAKKRPGEAAAEEAELYRRFAPRVRLYGLRHLRDEQVAADLVQHVLVLTLEKLRAGQVREPERIASFVLGTARLVALDVRRAAQRRRESPELLEAAAEAVAVEPPAEPLDLEPLRRCLQALAERERSVVVLTFFDERTAGQIAAQLGLSEGNVRVIRHRALGQLQRCLGLDFAEGSS
jgi:RNA polymerase sigma-70 factor, ECF subfamily